MAEDTVYNFLVKDIVEIQNGKEVKVNPSGSPGKKHLKAVVLSDEWIVDTFPRALQETAPPKRIRADNWRGLEVALGKYELVPEPASWKSKRKFLQPLTLSRLFFYLDENHKRRFVSIYVVGLLPERNVQFIYPLLSD